VKPLVYLRDKRADHLIKRAAASAAAPVSVHYVQDGEEGACVASTEGCAACRYVDGTRDGRQACRASRRKASTLALKRSKAEAFQCHLGFACVSTPCFGKGDDGFVLTVGPFCPSEAPLALEDDVQRGLEELNLDDEELPFSLDDIAFVPARAVPALAQWTADALEADYREWLRELAEADRADDEIGQQEARPAMRRRTVDPYSASEMATALATGNTSQVRSFIRAALAEADARPSTRLAVERARCATAVAAALEGAAHAGVLTDSAWDAFGALPAQLQRAETSRQLVDAAMKVLGPLARKTRKDPGRDTSLAALNAILVDRLTDDVTLKAVAQILGQSPTAITHRLQRKFNMSFSEYVSRLRVDRAKEMLRRTGLTVREVALRVGVNDPSNFNRLFRKLEHMTPRDYRKRFGKGAQRS
jgi:AraC-like DNA-binding protein/ligand-binding sensor protein